MCRPFVGRGLKLSDIDDILDRLLVSPLCGAWIETLALRVIKSKHVGCRPFVGRGLKLSWPVDFVPPARVAPLWGVD